MSTRYFVLVLVAIATLSPMDAAANPANAKKVRRVPAKGRAARVKPKAQRKSLDAAAVNNAQTQDPVAPGSAGSAVVRAQILLDRAHFSPGQIDGSFGDNLRIAITGYQQNRKLQPSGVVDADTWKALNADTAPALVPYTITADDEKGPFEPVPGDMMGQAKLKTLGYQSPQEELGERFHIDPKLLAQLNPGKDLAKAGEQILAPDVNRGQPAAASRVIVSKTARAVTAVAGDGSVIAQYPATIGSEHDPLPIGEWKITAVQRNPVFYYDPKLFWNAKPEDSKAKIAPGPNNPVGVVWIGLSKEHYGIHGTPEPGTIGHSESHGCIRLTNWDAEELSKMVKHGTPAILQEEAATFPANPPSTPELAQPPATGPQPAPPAIPPVDLPVAQMSLPIEGVTRADLRDTFTDGRAGHKHEAIDIMEPRGTPVHAVIDGTIQKLFLSKPGGITIYQFDNDGAYCYYYAHLDRYADGLREGMRVGRGDVIAYVGSTGDADAAAPHLHFTIFKVGPEKHWWKGEAMNPYPILLALVQVKK